MIKSDNYFPESNNGKFLRSFSLQPCHIKNKKQPNYRRVAQAGENHCVAKVNHIQTYGSGYWKLGIDAWTI